MKRKEKEFEKKINNNFPLDEKRLFFLLSYSKYTQEDKSHRATNFLFFEREKTNLSLRKK